MKYDNILYQKLFDITDYIHEKVTGCENVMLIGHENKQDILPILSQEMSDALCMCFTGRITRLVNTLSGFVPEVIMHISDNEQISNLVLLTKDKINPYNSDEHKALFQKEMEERGYSQEIIVEWMSYL